MHAEAGIEADVDSRPLRVSGFLCLLFGLLSILCPIGRPMLIMPLICFVLGFIALRKHSGETPVGTRPALVGLVLAVGFGICGLMLPLFKTYTLARQAEKFARDYIEVLAYEEDEFAMELNKDYVNRFDKTMSLEEHYNENEGASRQFAEFRENSIHEVIRSRGPKAEWVLAQPVRIYYSYDREHAEMVWMDPTGQVGTKIFMIMDYMIDSKGQGQWHIATVAPQMKRYVAESVL